MNQTMTTGQKVGFGVVVIIVLGLSICKLFIWNDKQLSTNQTIGQRVIAARGPSGSR